MTGRTFRLFVSSTFSDLVAERNALARWVFPKLRALCESRGYRFQAVDLRWGVPGEAAVDQQTVRICLEEIARCQGDLEDSPRPNFLVLLGDRYGWRPPPAAIPAAELDAMRPHLGPGAATVDAWYRLDENAVPPEYVLRPRRRPPFDDYEIWAPIERGLREHLASAAKAAGLGGKAGRKYGASATELEIWDGALDVPDAAEHVCAFFRTIDNPEAVEAALGDPRPEVARAAWDFLDTKAAGSGVAWDREAWNKLGELKAALGGRIGQANVWPYRAVWTNGALDLAAIGEPRPTESRPPAEVDELALAPGTLCGEVWLRLSRLITQQMQKLDAAQDEIEAERATHEKFRRDRVRAFQGREEPLAAIARYLSSGPPRPLVIHGVSGSGKSALMAMAVEGAAARHPDCVVERYIGAAPGASEAAPLLASLSREISHRFGGDETTVPADYAKLVADFPGRLKLGTPDRPIILFLDALDQLGDTDDGRRLVWLPRELPPHVRVIVSTLTEPQYQCFPELGATAQAGDLVELRAMSADEGDAVLSAWLAQAKPPRALTGDQRAEILGRFRGDGLPLYLKLAFEEARRWHSYDGVTAGGLAADVPGLISGLFQRLGRPEHHGPVVVARALGYLAAARFGLADDEMLDLLWRDDGARDEFKTRHKHHALPEGMNALPPVIWSRLYFDLRPYLTEREVFGVRLLGFYHRQLGEVATELYGGGPAVHGMLADYFAGRWRIPDTHALLEIVGQLARAEREQEARELLLTYEWMEKLLRATDIRWLLGDYDALKLDRGEACGLAGGALRLASHVLAQRPEELASQLLGRMLDFEEPEIRRLVADARASVTPPTLLPLAHRLDAPGGPLLRTLEGHRHTVAAVATTPDARTAVSASWDRTLKVWDLASGALLRTLEGHQGAVESVAIAPDGRAAVSASYDKTLKVWDLASGRLLRTLEGHQGPVLAVAVSPDGRAAVSVSSDRTLKVWDLASGGLLCTLEDHQSVGDVRAVAITPDGRAAVSASSDRTLKVWDLVSGGLLRTLEDHEGRIRDVAITPDGRAAVSSSLDGTVRIWHLASGALLHTLRGHQMGGDARAVAVTPDGRAAVSSSADQLKVWDLTSGALLRTLRGHQGEVWAVAITPDGRAAVSASYDKTLKVWDLASGGLLRTLEDHQGSVRALAIAPDGRATVSASADQTLKVWDLASGALLRTLRGHQLGGDVRAVAIAPDGRATVSASADQTLKVWNLASGALLHTLRGHQGAVWAVAMTPDGRAAISAALDKTLKIWDLASGALLHTLRGHQGGVNAVAITLDGRAAISAALDQTLKVWNLASGALLHTLRGHQGAVWAVATTPDCRIAVSASSDRTLKIWDLASGALLRTLEGHQDSVRLVAITPDGRTAVSASEDKTLKVWNLASSALLRTLEGHQDSVRLVAVAPDGRTAVSASEDKTLKVWNLASGRVLASFTGDAAFHAVAVRPAEPSGLPRVVAGDNLGRVHFLDLLLPDPIP